MLVPAQIEGVIEGEIDKDPGDNRLITTELAVLTEEQLGPVATA